MVILALFSIITFLIAVASLFVSSKDISFNSEYFNQKIEELKQRIDKAEKSDDTTDEEVESIGLLVIALLIAVFVSFVWTVTKAIGLVVISFGRKMSEPILIIWALVSLVGVPLYGQIALAVWLLSWPINAFFAKIDNQRQLNQATNDPQRTLGKNWIKIIINFLPDLYLLYVFLVLINVISYLR